MLAYYKVSMEPALYYVLQKLSVQHGKLYLPSDSGDRTSPAAVLLQKAPEYFLALSVLCGMSVRLFQQIPVGSVLCGSIPCGQFHKWPYKLRFLWQNALLSLRDAH